MPGLAQAARALWLVTLAAVALGCSARSVANIVPDAGGAGGATGTSRWKTAAKLGAPGLRKIWGSSDTDIWVAGSTYVSPGPRVFLEAPAPSALPRLVHYDGKDWRDVAAMGSWLSNVGGTAADDVWTTGEVLSHFDGEAWTEIATGFQSSPVWGTGRSDVWFADFADLWHWDGRALSPISSPKIDGIHAIWGFSTSDVWAGGGNGGLLHWDGTAWSLTPLDTTLYVLGLWGARPDDLWGVGNAGNRLHWDGQRITGTSEDWTSFEAIVGTRDDDIWAVGECCWQDGHTFQSWFSHFDGAAWTSFTLPELDDVSGIWVSPSGTYWAVAGGYTIIKLAVPGAPPDALVAQPSAECAAASALTNDLTALADDLRRDGGPCTTLNDCHTFVPVVTCGDAYRVTACPLIVASADDARARVTSLEAGACPSIPAVCRAQAFLDCPKVFAQCEAGRCRTVDAQP